MSLLILNFHGVGPVTRVIDEGERNCWLDQGHFETVLDMVRGCPQVKLTVDDGNISDFEIVLPALLRRGLHATFFVCSGRLATLGFMNRDHLCELLARGMAVGSHGVDHLPWRGLSRQQLSAELVGSREALESVCGTSIQSAACPFGAYDRRVLSGLRKAGYRFTYTSDGGNFSESQVVRARNTITRMTPIVAIKHLVEHGSAGWGQALISAKTLIKRFR